MDRTKAARIIRHVVESTQRRCREFDRSWEDIDRIFIHHGYEQGGLEMLKFRPLLESRECFSIDALGSILTEREPSKKYDPNYAGRHSSPFYIELRDGERGEPGRNLYDAITDFHRPGAGSKGRSFWQLMWWLLRSCRWLKMEHGASFRCYVLNRFGKFVRKDPLGDEEFLETTPQVWNSFLERMQPWKPLMGVGCNTFDFIFRDIVEAEFAAYSYKLDDANKRFLRITGMTDLIGGLGRKQVIAFMRGLATEYTLRDINRGIYTYCSKTESHNFGYCRSRADCERCGVNRICEKRFKQKNEAIAIL